MGEKERDMLRIRSQAADVEELSVFCQPHFNKTLIGQAGSIGRKADRK